MNSTDTVPVLSSDAEYLDRAQQVHDAIGEEPCVVECGRTGPQGLCASCKATFTNAYPDRDTYERVAFGADEKDRSVTDRIADLVFGKADTVQIVATTPQGFPLTTDGDIDVAAMSPQMKADFWAFCDAEQRKANDYYGGYKTAVRTALYNDICERRKQNEKAVAIPHKALVVEVQDEFTRYQFNADLLPDIAQFLADEEFEKIAKFVDEVIPDPIPAHWEIKSTASGTVKSLISRYDGTPEGELLKKFMWRDKTGESLKIEFRKSVQNVTPLEKAS